MFFEYKDERDVMEVGWTVFDRVFSLARTKSHLTFNFRKSVARATTCCTTPPSGAPTPTAPGDAPTPSTWTPARTATASPTAASTTWPWTTRTTTCRTQSCNNLSRIRVRERGMFDDRFSRTYELLQLFWRLQYIVHSTAIHVFQAESTPYLLNYQL